MNQYLLNEKRNWVPLEEYRRNIRKLLEIGKSLSARMVFVGLLPVDRSVDPIPWKPEAAYRNEFVKAYNDAAREACQEEGVDFIELFDSWIKMDYARILEDGVHPNSEGHERIFQAVRDFLVNRDLI